MKAEVKRIGLMMANRSVCTYVIENLRKSLKLIGYSKSLIEDLIDCFNKLDFSGFQERHFEELEKVHSIGFFQGLVPIYFGKQVIPYIPASKKILDVGCGTGILAHKLAESKRFEQILGIDINSYPEWRQFRDKNVSFEVIKEKDFSKYLKNSRPETIVLTWTLHHMEFEEQERYLKEIYSSLDNVTMVVLEDAFAVKTPPKEDIGVLKSFNALSFSEKNDTMSVLDWAANRILERRDKIPIPFAYRTLEDWQKLFEKTGFKIVEKRYIGFPENRDINTPQSLLVVRK